jgi:hypothetical protein
VDNARIRAMLIAVAVLAALRVLIVPWAGAQGEAHERLQVLTRRLDRSQGVVQAREAIGKAGTVLKTQGGVLEARFPTAPDPQAFKLEAQRDLERLARASSMEIKIFDVVAEGEIPKSGLSYARVRLAVYGTLRNAARLHAEIEGGLANSAIREWQATVANAGASSGDSPADVVVVADLFYRSPHA